METSPRVLGVKISCIFAPHITRQHPHISYVRGIKNSQMTKADIVNKISEKTGIEKKEAMAIVEAFMHIVKTSMCEGKNVYLRGFGTFFIKKRASKPGRIISKNITITIPAHNIPAFKPVKSFVRKLGKNVPVKE